MPNVIVSVNNTETTVVRPAIESIVKALQTNTDMGDGTVVIPDQNGNIKIPNSFITGKTTHASEVSPNTYMTLKASVSNDPLANHNPKPLSNQHRPIFLTSPPTKFSIHPVYVTKKLDIGVEYVSISKERVESWYNDITLAVNDSTRINLHKIDYTYILPPKVYGLMQEVYSIMSKAGVVDTTMLEFIQANSTGKLTTLSSSTNSNYNLAVTETQTRIVGRFEFDTIPDKFEKDSETGKYSIGFNYTVSFEVPVSVRLDYPPVICNTVLPAKYILPKTNVINNETYSSNDKTALNSIESHKMDKYRSFRDNIIIAPTWDDKTPEYKIKGLIPICSLLSVIDFSAPRHILNLRDLGDLEIDVDLLDWFSSGEHEHLTTLYGSPYNVSVYKDDLRLDHTTINVDSELNVTTTFDMGKCNTYRVVFSIVFDISKLTQIATNRLLESADMTALYMVTLNNDYKHNKEFIDTLATKNITLHALTTVFRNYTNKYKGEVNDLYSGRKTVMTSLIVSRSI